MDMDLDNVKQQDVVLALCKLNNFHYGDVWVHLRKTMPVTLDIPQEFFQGGMNEIVENFRGWDMRGIIAVDSTVTKKNPDGKDKVVGFVLYQIHRETKIELEVLFLLVSKAYRNKRHATNMLKTLEDRHIFTHGNDVVKFFTVKVDRNDTVVEFYRKLGYDDMSKVAGYADCFSTYSDYTHMIRRGVLLTHEMNGAS
jgi:ribosomal protein S18 acetylase RimI-like enzyme